MHPEYGHFELPTAQRVIEDAVQMKNRSKVDQFLLGRSKVEYVLEALVRDAQTGAAAMSALREDESALPAHVLDGDYGLLRHKMLHSRRTEVRWGGIIGSGLAGVVGVFGGVSKHP
ncbi:hypothetical protein FOA52_008137 [Chlamydomonas sp. UWO 241]|nr:hypothetical protein FOA52_008137 [Chlamydomonas sp. UWO 241]